MRSMFLKTSRSESAGVQVCDNSDTHTHDSPPLAKNEQKVNEVIREFSS